MPFISGGGGGGGSGTVTSVSSANTSIAVATPTSTPALTVGTFDLLATNNPPAAAVAMNAKKITGLANGSAASDAAAFGQLAMVLLSDTTLAVDGTFDVASISQAYTDLKLVLFAKGTDAGAADVCCLRFNNDSGANYGYQGVTGNIGNAAGTEFNSGTFGRMLNTMAAGGLGAAVWSMAICDILMYANTVANKLAIHQDPAGFAITGGGRIAEAAVSMWASQAAINRIQIFGNATANLKAGSRLRIYGRL